MGRKKFETREADRPIGTRPPPPGIREAPKPSEPRPKPKSREK